MTSFSDRHGYNQSKEIKYRDELPETIRLPIYQILRRYLPAEFLLERTKELLNPYGIDVLPRFTGDLSVTKEEDSQDLVAFKRIFLGCKWFQIYDIVEDAFDQLRFHEEELAHPDEAARAFPLQQAINDYFVHAGIGWKMAAGQIIRRAEETFEKTIQTAVDVLSEERPTAARHIQLSIEALSKRPEPDTAGAVSHAISAIECILGDTAGVQAGEKSTLGQFLNDENFPGSLKKAMEGVWGFACNEGARHGKEGVEPQFNQAQFAVATCAAMATLLNSVHPSSRLS